MKKTIIPLLLLFAAFSCTSNDSQQSITNILSQSDKDIAFTINIGKNVSGTGPHISDYSILEEIYKDGIIQSDGSILVYRPALYFNVDPGNETYYAEDGVLYTKADGKPVLYESSN